HVALVNRITIRAVTVSVDETVVGTVSTGDRATRRPGRHVVHGAGVDVDHREVVDLVIRGLDGGDIGRLVTVPLLAARRCVRTEFDVTIGRGQRVAAPALHPRNTVGVDGEG